MHPSKDRYIVFDFDGTLARTDDLLLEIYNEIAEALSLKKVQPEEVPHLKQLSSKKALKRLKLYWYRLPKVWQLMVNELSKRSHEIELHQNIDHLLKECDTNGIPFGLISSNGVHVIEQVFERYKLPEPLFIGSSSALFKKHKVFKKLSKKHGLAYSKALYVGDETRDLDVGKNLKIPVISVDWGFSSKDTLMNAGAQVVCSQVNELSLLIQRFMQTGSLN